VIPFIDEEIVRRLRILSDASPTRIYDLIDRPMSAREVLARQDGEWADVPDRDRLRVVLRGRVLTYRVLRLFAVRCGRRAIARRRGANLETDPRLIDACTVGEWYARRRAGVPDVTYAAQEVNAILWGATPGPPQADLAMLIYYAVAKHTPNLSIGMDIADAALLACPPLEHAHENAAQVADLLELLDEEPTP